MADKSFVLLEVVTPKGVVLSEQVDEVVAPSVNGEFGVLPGHLPMLAALSTGLLHYREGDKTTDVAVSGGFVEVVHDKALLLTNRFMTKAEIDTDDRVLEVRERLKEVDAKLESWDGDLSDPARLALIDEEQWLAVKLELYGDPAVPKVLEASRSVDFSDLLADVNDSDSLTTEQDAADEADAGVDEGDDE